MPASALICVSARARALSDVTSRSRKSCKLDACRERALLAMLERDPDGFQGDPRDQQCCADRRGARARPLTPEPPPPPARHDERYADDPPPLRLAGHEIAFARKS